MNEIIKKAVRAGNSSAIIVPRAWLNKEVRVELIKKTPETILLDVISIIGRYIKLQEVIGIYLAGSYARREEEEDSDIDILVITDNIDKEMIKEGIYNILIVSEELLIQKLNRNLFPVGQMLKEAKPLLNSRYLNLVDIKVTKKNTEWYIKTTKEKLELIKEIIDKTNKNKKKYVSDRVIYTLILRIRTLYIIEKLIKNQEYLKKDFERLIKKVSKGQAYQRYLAVKNDLEEKYLTSLAEAERLYNYLKSQLERVKKMI